jgi:hypothetical protein
VKDELHLYFESCSRSAPDWLEKGKGLLIIAEIINKELLDICHNYDPCPPDEIQPKFLGLIDALMLLLGFSLENAIKGYIVSHKPDYQDISELYQLKFNASGGHGIHEMISFNIKNITSREQDLLLRIEQSLIWAGRYNSPKNYKKNKNKIIGIHPDFREKDFNYGKQLFEKIERFTNELWEKNEKLFLIWYDSNKSSDRIKNL